AMPARKKSPACAGLPYLTFALIGGEIGGELGCLFVRKRETRLLAFALLLAGLIAADQRLRGAFEKHFVVVDVLAAPRWIGAAKQSLVALRIDFVNLERFHQPGNTARGTGCPLLQAIARRRRCVPHQGHLPKSAAQIIVPV